MSTVTTIKSRCPAWIQARYGDSYFINWVNLLLEELSGSGLMHSLVLERGAKVQDYVWIDRPAGLRTIHKIFNPASTNQQYTWEIVNNRIKLTNATVEEATSPDTASAFQNYATTGIDVNIADAEEDDYKDFLFLVTAGTYAGRGYVVSDSSASAGGYAALTFYHPLSAALDGTKVTAAELISYENYVMIKHTSSYEEVSDASDEVPIDDMYERRVTDAWIDWMVLKEVDRSSKQCRTAQYDFEKVMVKVKGDVRSSVVCRPIPRVIPGLDQYKNGSSIVDKQFEADLD